MPISCHFQDCKALLLTSLTHVSGAIASVQTFTFLPLKLGCDFIFVFHSKYGRIFNRWDIQRKEWRDHENWVCRFWVVQDHWKRHRSIDHKYDFLLVGHCKYSSMCYRFGVMWHWVNYNDLEIRVRGHSRSFKLVPFETCVRFLIRLP